MHYIKGLRDASWYDEEDNKEMHAPMKKQFEAATRMPLRTFQRLLKEMKTYPFVWKNLAKNAMPTSVHLMATLRYPAIGCVWEYVCVARSVAVERICLFSDCAGARLFREVQTLILGNIRVRRFSIINIIHPQCDGQAR